MTRNIDITLHLNRNTAIVLVYATCCFTSYKLLKLCDRPAKKK